MTEDDRQRLVNRICQLLPDTAGEMQTALATHMMAIEDTEQAACAISDFAMKFVRAGDPDQLRRAVALSEEVGHFITNTEARSVHLANYAALLMISGQAKDAEAAWLESLECYQDQTSAVLGLVQVYYHQGKTHEFRMMVDRAVSLGMTGQEMVFFVLASSAERITFEDFMATLIANGPTPIYLTHDFFQSPILAAYHEHPMFEVFTSKLVDTSCTM